jgi:hypothetical protein
VLGCATGPAIVARAHVEQPALVASLFVIAPPAFYVAKKGGHGGFDLQFYAQSLVSGVSRRLNEAGNNTSTTLNPTLGMDLRAIVTERARYSGVTEVLLLAPKKATYRGPVMVSLEAEAKLYDARTFKLLWEFSYDSKNGGGRGFDGEVIKALRASGFVK